MIGRYPIRQIFECHYLAIDIGLYNSKQRSKWKRTISNKVSIFMHWINSIVSLRTAEINRFSRTNLAIAFLRLYKHNSMLPALIKIKGNLLISNKKSKALPQIQKNRCLFTSSPKAVLTLNQTSKKPYANFRESFGCPKTSRQPFLHL